MRKTRNGKLLGLFPNPFTPGYGKRPPHLAGRQEEIYDIFKNVGATTNGHLGVRDVVIHGSRGSGKTALLRVIAEELERLRVQATVELMTGTDMRSVDDVYRELIGLVGQSLREAPNPQERKRNLDWREAQAKWQRGELSRNRVRKGLVEECRSKPLILLIDGAHLMPPVACGELLNEALTIRDMGGPMIAVMAGNPRLADQAGISQASFMERAEIMGLELLDEQSSGDAVRVPLGEAGVRVTETALRRVIDDCRGAPHFLQLWGSALWQRASACAKKTLDHSDVARIEPAMRLEREETYPTRIACWKGADRDLPVAVASHLQHNGWVEKAEIGSHDEGNPHPPKLEIR